MMGSFGFYQMKATSMKEEGLRNMFHEASKCVCTPPVASHLKRAATFAVVPY